MIEITVNGEKYPLLMNGAAMFALRDLCGDSPVKAIMEDTADAMQTACRVACVLAEQGELLRRWQGYDPKDMLTPEEMLLSLTPNGVIRLKEAIANAVADGYQRSHEDENQEIDIGLAELNKKK